MASENPKAAPANKSRGPATTPADEQATQPSRSDSRIKSSAKQTNQSTAPGARAATTMPASLAKPGSIGAASEEPNGGRSTTNRGDALSVTGQAPAQTALQTAAPSGTGRGRSVPSGTGSAGPDRRVSVGRLDSEGQTTRQDSRSGDRPSGGFNAPADRSRGGMSGGTGGGQSGTTSNRSTPSGNRPPDNGRGFSSGRPMQGNRSGGGGARPGGSRPSGGQGRPGGRSRGGYPSRGGTRGSAPRPAPRGDVSEPAKPRETGVAPVTEVIVPGHITVRDFADMVNKSPIEVIKTLMNYGMMVPITESIDFDTAVVVGEELGITVKPEVLLEPVVTEEVLEAPKTLRQEILAAENPDQLVLRPPVVTVLGHVDHGKTTLLDAIRETRVVEGEAGGITQHIGAYQVERQGRKITFLDTPGHEAFTAMRARGAMVTDMAVLVVAADDGVMPQTKEAISHARAAQVPILVALNKIDKPNANPDRVKQELADNGLLIEEYGGDVICVPVSAKMRRGIDDLLESILLVVDIDPLMANPNGRCMGTVIESRLDRSRGPMATLLVQNGTLRVGDSIVTGEAYGKIRAMYDDKGQPINEAPPATPAVVLGLGEVSVAGDTFSVATDERAARAIAVERQERKRAEVAAVAPKAVSLDSIFAQAQSGKVKELDLILKADVQGSIEPIASSLEKLGEEKLRVKILHQATGNITESDVMLAVASSAIILGFSVSVDAAAQRTAEAEGVDIRIYNIIYNLVEDVQKALTGLLEPVYREVVTGHAEIRAVFRITKVGRVAGCYITDGEIARNSMARIKRGGETIAEDRLTSLKRFQEDAAEVKTGYECGITLGNFGDFQEGDIIEAYKKERVS
jgi:translation initiation factor IF-2